jgi:hypothetical protein
MVDIEYLVFFMAEVDGLDEKIEDDLLLQVLYFITLFGI